MYSPKLIKVAMAEEGVGNAEELARLVVGRHANTIRAALNGQDVRTSTLEAIAHALNRTERDFYLPTPTSRLVADSEAV